MRDDDTDYRIVIVSSRRRRRRREITTQRRRKARTDFDFDFSHSFERGSDRSETIHPRIRDGATYLEILGAKFKRSLFLRRHPSFVRSILESIRTTTTNGWMDARARLRTKQSSSRRIKTQKTIPWVEGKSAHFLYSTSNKRARTRHRLRRQRRDRFKRTKGVCLFVFFG